MIRPVARLVFGILLGLLVPAVLALGSCGDSASAPVMVPNVLGMTQEDAAGLLASLDLNCSVEQVDSAAFPPGQVCDQDPRFGAQVARDGFVSLMVVRQVSGGAGETTTTEAEAADSQTPSGSSGGGGAETVTTEKRYTIALSKVGEGRVSKSPDQSSYAFGDRVTLTALPEAGWGFEMWTGSAGIYSRVFDYEIWNEDVSELSFQAHFVRLEFTLTVSKQGDGRVSKSPDQSSYPSETWVTLTATPAAGWQFSHWLLDGQVRSTGNRVYTLLVNEHHDVTAVFTQ